MSDLSTLKKILFEFDVLRNSQRKYETFVSPGEALLHYFGQDPEEMFQPYNWFNDRILNDLTERINERKPAQFGGENSDTVKISNRLVKLLRSQDHVKVASFFDQVIPFLHESDFVLKKQYTIASSISTVYGKWP